MAKFVMSCIALAIFMTALASVDAQPGAQVAPASVLSEAAM
jgi:hypothetical protein